MRLLLTGGGTGGHLYPGIAIAEEWLKSVFQGKVLFVVSHRGLEEKVLNNTGFKCRFVSLEIPGRVGWIRMPYLLGKSLVESLRIVREFNPHAIVGLGGFSSGPVAVAGKILGKPVFVQEQNILPGLTNRIIARFAKKIFLSYPGSEANLPRKKCVLTGNPVRGGLKGEKKDYGAFGFSRERFTVLAFGGSQGAQKINQAMIEAVALLADIEKRIQILHITGRADVELVEKGYRGFKHYTTGYLMEMDNAYAVADLVVCRAGATSLAEITALGKASVLIPYPHAAADHQTKNADFLVSNGAAVKIPDRELDGKTLARLIRDYLEHPEKIKKMEDKSRKMGSFEAAQKIVREIRDV